MGPKLNSTPSNKQHKSIVLALSAFQSLSRAFQEPFKRIKMSSNMTVDQLLAERERIDAAINAMGGAKKQEKKQKRKSAPAGPWAAWTKKVLEENKEAVEAFKATQESKLGAHLKWISANKGKDSAEYKAFAEAFVPVAAPEAAAEEVESVASAPSAASSAPSAEAPKRRGPKKLADMTPEEKAAHDAKVAERKAKKEAEKVAAEVAGKAAEEAPVAAPADVVVAAPAAEAALELLPFKLDGVNYFRLGAKTADGEIAWEGDLWYNKKGVRGSYVGSLLEDGSIDTDAEEPTLE
jgi:hypothetical protein